MRVEEKKRSISFSNLALAWLSSFHPLKQKPTLLFFSSEYFLRFDFLFCDYNAGSDLGITYFGLTLTLPVFYYCPELRLQNYAIPGSCQLYLILSFTETANHLD